MARTEVLTDIGDFADGCDHWRTSTLTAQP